MKRFGFPLRYKLMALLLLVALAPAGLLAALSLQALNQVVSSARHTGVAALEREVTARLDSSAQQNASRLDVSFEQARAEATALARFTGFLFSHPDRYASGVDVQPAAQGLANQGLTNQELINQGLTTEGLQPQTEPPAPGEVAPLNPTPNSPAQPEGGLDGLPAYGLAGRLRHQPQGIWANEQRDLVGVYLPGNAKDLSDAQRELAITSHLDSWLSATHGVNPVRLSAYVVLQDGLTRIFPNWGLGSAGDAAAYSPTGASYFQLAAPAENKQGQTIWTPPYEDRTGLGRVVTASAPIYTDDGKFLGVACVDVLLSDVTKSLQGVNTSPSGYSLLIDREGRVVTAPDQALQDLALPQAPLAPGGDVDLNLQQSDNSEVRQLLPDLTSSDRAGIRGLSLSGADKYLAFAPLRKTGWTLVLVEPTADVMRPAAQVVDEIEQARTALISKLEVILLLLLGLVLLISLIAGTAVTRPLARLTAGVKALGFGKLQPIAEESDDEIGDLAKEFNRMAEQLTQLNLGLEQKVEERTAELARKAEQLRALNRASQQMTALLDPDELLRTLAALVADTFGYAQAAIFLVDQAEDRLTLRAGVSSDANGHRVLMPSGLWLPLPDSGGGAVAVAARRGQPVLVADAAADLNQSGCGEWLENAPTAVAAFFLHSRSMLALPVRLGDQTLGVLAVAGDGPGAFSEDDLFALSTLADQMAVALENARLFDEERQRRLEARDLAIAEERNRMAREIHDTLAQGFLGILLQLQAAEGELGPGAEGVAARLSRAADLARESLQEARRSVWNLRPQRLERASLPEALRQETGGLGAADQATLGFAVRGEERPLPPAVEAALLRVAQEALANIRKHAAAGHVSVELAYDPGGVRLTVTDDGRGFNPEQAAAEASQRKDRGGFGLFSMRERVEALGGRLELTSEIGKGTTVRVFVPVR